MKYKIFYIAAFILMVSMQWWIPAQVIWEQEDALETGKPYKFKTAPVDPYDPFRGKYITLNFESNTFSVRNSKNWTRSEEVYVYFEVNEEGFAEIDTVSKTTLKNTKDYIKTKVNWVNNYDQTISVDYPFDRFYMEEGKAYDAEKLYINNQMDSTTTTYALVKIKDGKAVLGNVFIDEIPIKDLVKEQQQKSKNTKD